MTYATWKSLKNMTVKAEAAAPAVALKSGLVKGDTRWVCQGWQQWDGSAWADLPRSNRPSEA